MDVYVFFTTTGLENWVVQVVWRDIMEMNTADRVLIATNPMAGAGSARMAIEHLQGLLTGRGYRVEVLTDLGGIAEAANHLYAQGQLRALVGVGGDGTAGALLNCTAPGVPIALLARGTENLLAKYYRLGTTPEAVADLVEHGTATRVDSGVANGRLFSLMASCGFDAEVVARLHEQRRGHIRHWSYVRPIFDAIRSYDYPELKIHLTLADGSVQLSQVRWFFAFNLPCYARGLPIAPQSKGNDGLLDVCTFSRGSFWHGLRYLAATATGHHEQLADCCTGRVTKIRVECERPAPYQVDGDPGGNLPLEISVLPGRMTLLTP